MTSSSTPDCQAATAEKIVLKGENFDVILADGQPAIRINVGGHVIVMTAEKWHEAARQHLSEKWHSLYECWPHSVHEYDGAFKCSCGRTWGAISNPTGMCEGCERDAAPQSVEIAGRSPVREVAGSTPARAAAAVFSSDKQETPQTDKVDKHIQSDEFPLNPDLSEYEVMRHHARQLERELADEKRKLQYHKDAINRMASLTGTLGETSESVVTKAISLLSATRESVLEEAAKVCEQMRPINPPTRAVQMQRETLDNAARLIRALKQTQYVAEKK